MITQTPEPLSLTQIKALRNADSVVLRFERDEDKPFSHNGLLDLSKETDQSGFRETLHVDIPTHVSVANYGQRDYSDDGKDYTLPPAIKGSWVILSLKTQPEWQTFISFVRAGDKLTQEWVVDNRNELLKRANLTQHEVKIRITRPNKEGTNAKLFTFLLDAGVRTPMSGEVTRDPDWRPVR